MDLLHIAKDRMEGKVVKRDIGGQQRRQRQPVSKRLKKITAHSDLKVASESESDASDEASASDDDFWFSDSGEEEFSDDGETPL